MKHVLRLHAEPFSLLKNGAKIWENRLYDEKRQTMRVGDTITFVNRENSAEIEAEIVELRWGKAFAEMHGCFVSAQELDDMRLYYSAEDEERFGVVAIRLKLLP